MPSELEIIGSPSFKVAANMNLSDYFNDMTDDVLNAASNSKVLLCTNPPDGYMTFVLRMEIFNNDEYRCDDVDEDLFDIDGEGNISINGIEIPVKLMDDIDDDKKYLVLENDHIISESDEPFTLAFQGIDDYLDGFEFDGVKAKIYISGTELVDVISIDLFRVITGEPNESLIDKDEVFLKGPSGLENLDEDEKEYDGQDLPPRGKNINISDIINNGGDLSIGYKIYIKKDSIIYYNWLLKQHTVTAEIVFWLPMTFKSVKENANFVFPEFFDEITDVIESLAETDSIEDMTIKISISPLNPFGEGKFIINDAGYGDITFPLEMDNFTIRFTKEELNYINNNPYNPNFKISYPVVGKRLGIPMGDIIITTISLDAKLKYNMEL